MARNLPFYILIPLLTVLSTVTVQAQKQITVNVDGGKERLQGGAYASDHSDNIYMAYYRNEKELVVSKSDACGQLQWSTALDVFQKDGWEWSYRQNELFRIVASPKGWVYIVSSQRNDNTSLPSDSRLIVQCLDPEGQYKWTRISQYRSFENHLLYNSAVTIWNGDNLLFTYEHFKNSGDPLAESRLHITHIDTTGRVVSNRAYFTKQQVIHFHSPALFLNEKENELIIIRRAALYINRMVFDSRSLALKSNEALTNLSDDIYFYGPSIPTITKRNKKLVHSLKRNNQGYLENEGLVQFTQKMDTLFKWKVDNQKIFGSNTTIYEFKPGIYIAAKGSLSGLTFRSLDLDKPKGYEVQSYLRSNTSNYSISNPVAPLSSQGILAGESNPYSQPIYQLKFKTISSQLEPGCNDTFSLELAPVEYDTIIVTKKNDPLSLRAPMAFKDTAMGSRNTFVNQNIICLNGYQNPDAHLGKDTLLCNNQSLQLKARSAPFADTRYLWSNGDTTYITSIDSSGTYSVQVTQSFCSFYDTINVTFVPQIDVSVGEEQTFCKGDSFALFLNQSLPFKTTWTYPDQKIIVSDSLTNDTYYTKQSGRYNLRSDQPTGCPLSIDFELKEVIVEANGGADDTLCFGLPFTLQGKGVGKPQWTPTTLLNNDTSFNPTWIPKKDTQFVLTSTLGQCQKSDTVNLRVWDSLRMISPIERLEGCPGDIVDVEIKWEGGKPGYGVYEGMDLMYTDDYSTSRTASFWENWKTEIVVTDACGARVTKQIFTSSKASILSQINLNHNDTIRLNSRINASISTTEEAILTWLLNGKEIAEKTHQISHLPGDAGHYKLQALVQNSECPDTATTYIYVFEPIWFAPNAFSPNGDQKNESWKISCHYCSVQDLEIYNRWGQCIYQSETDVAWSGFYPEPGKVVPIGVYIYKAIIKDESGEYSFIKGAIHVVK